MCNFFRKYWLLAILVCVLALLIGLMAINGIEHSAYTAEFEEKCKASGGVMFVPKGVKGWPVPECRNPDYIINID